MAHYIVTLNQMLLWHHRGHSKSFSEVLRVLNFSGRWRKQKEEAEQRDGEWVWGGGVEGEEEKEGGGSCQSVSIFILRPH